MEDKLAVVSPREVERNQKLAEFSVMNTDEKLSALYEEMTALRMRLDQTEDNIRDFANPEKLGEFMASMLGGGMMPGKGLL
jgi:hypothetical protein